jgi:DNA-binding NarL/FixJ family response regulator
MHVLIVDDHAMFREGLVALLAREDPRIEISEAGSLGEARQIASGDGPSFDLVLLDLNLGDMDTGRVATEAVPMFPGVPVVVLSGMSDPRLIWRAIEAGATGFIPKSLSFQEFSAALARTLAGEVYLPQMSIDEGLRRLRRQGGLPAGGAEGVAAAVGQLSPRQLEILRLLVYGLSNREIALHLQISEGTVKTHMGRILPALGVHSRAEAVYLLAQVEHSIGRPSEDSGRSREWNS